MAAMTDDVSMRVLFDPDGEGLDFTDMNDLQTRLNAMIFDGLIAPGIPNAIDDPASPGTQFDPECGYEVVNFFDGLVLTTTPGTGHVIAGGTARELDCIPGVIFAVLGEPLGGDAETIAPFRLANLVDSGILQTAIGGANPRIDVVEMKLEYVDSDPTARDFEDAVTREPTSQTPNKRRRVQATVQIKQGAEHATAPVYPTCSAGFSPYASVYIPAAHNAVHDPTNIRDMRWPVGNLRVVDVHANQAWLPGADPWTLSPGNPNPQFAIIGPASGTGHAYFPCPISSKTARVVGIGMYGVVGGGPVAKLVRVTHTPTAPTITDLITFDSDLFDTEAYRVATAIQMMDDVVNAGPETRGVRAASTRNGMPWWCSGYSAGPARRRAAMTDDFGTHLALKVTATSNVARVEFVRWFIAEGM